MQADTNAMAAEAQNEMIAFLRAGDLRAALERAIRHKELCAQLGDFAYAAACSDVTSLYTQLQLFDEALASALEYKQIFEERNYLQGQVFASKSLVQIYWEMQPAGLQTEGIAECKRLIALAQQTGNTDIEIWGNKVMGITLKKLSRFKSALEHLDLAFERASAVRSETSLTDQATLYHHKAEILRLLGDTDEATACWEALIRICIDIGLPKGAEGQVRGYACLSSVSLKSGRADVHQAFEYAEKALLIATRMNNHSLLAIAYGGMGEVYSHGELHETAYYMFTLQHLYASSAGSESSSVAAEAQHNMAQSLEKMGRVEEAKDLTLTYLKFCLEWKDNANACAAYINLCNHAVILGQRETALSFINKALTLSQEHGLKYQEAAAYQAKGLLCAMWKEYQLAREAMQQAITLREAAAQRVEVCRCLFVLSHVQARSGDGAGAVESVRRMLELVEDIRIPALTCLALSKISWMLYDSNQLKHAECLFLKSIRVFEELAESYQSDLLMTGYFNREGHLYDGLIVTQMELQKYPEALMTAERGRCHPFLRALQSGDSSHQGAAPDFDHSSSLWTAVDALNAPVLEYWINYDQNRMVAWLVLPCYRKLEHCFVLEMSELRRRDEVRLKKLLGENIEDKSFEHLIHACMDKLSMGEWCAKSRTLLTRDELQLEINDILRDSYLTLGLSSRPEVSSPPAIMDRHHQNSLSSAVVAAKELLHSTHTFSAATKAVLTSELGSYANEEETQHSNLVDEDIAHLSEGCPFVGSLQTKDNSDGMPPAAPADTAEQDTSPEQEQHTLAEIACRVLHDLLIGPFLPRLQKHFHGCKNGQHVVIVPHKSLFTIPFGALQDPKSVRLIQRYTVIQAPSIFVQHALLTRRGSDERVRHQGGSEGFSCLLKRVSLLGKQMFKAGSPLPDEVGELKQIFDEDSSARTRTYSGEAGRGPSVTDTISELCAASLAHISTHGVDNGGLILRDDDDPEKDSLLMPRHVRALPRHISMPLQVTLSSCYSASARIWADGPQGFVRELLCRRAYVVIVSLSTVGTQSAIAIFKRMYKNQMNGASTAVAMREAQLWLARSGQSVKEWAPFSVMGYPVDLNGPVSSLNSTGTRSWRQRWSVLVPTAVVLSAVGLLALASVSLVRAFNARK